MYNQDYSDSGDNDGQVNSAQKRRQIEMEMAIAESDLKKLLPKKAELDAELRKIKKEQDRLRVEMSVKQDEQKVLIRKIELGEEELKRLRKKLNVF